MWWEVQLSRWHRPGLLGRVACRVNLRHTRTVTWSSYKPGPRPQKFELHEILASHLEGNSKGRRPCLRLERPCPLSTPHLCWLYARYENITFLINCQCVNSLGPFLFALPKGWIITSMTTTNIYVIALLQTWRAIITNDGEVLAFFPRTPPRQTDDGRLNEEAMVFQIGHDVLPHPRKAGANCILYRRHISDDFARAVELI